MTKSLITIAFVFAGIIAIGFLLLAPPGIDTVHQKIVGSPIPGNAKNIQVDRSNVVNSWNDNYCIISYNLEPAFLLKTLAKPPPGFLDWKPLGEIGVGSRLFTSAQMHHAQISSKTDGRLYRAVLVDLDENQVYVISVFN